MGSKDRPPLEFIIGKKVQWFRKQRGWTQEELGRRAGLSAGRIASIEAIKTTPRKLEDLKDVAKALGVTVDVLTEAPKKPRAVVAYPRTS
jgi:transcriptional regulator with XRE-family HTH domain